MFTQLNPSIPMDTPKGSGLALAVIDYGLEHSLLWVVAIDDTGEIWCVPSGDARAQKNWSAGRLVE
jgi:hypothetical protein